MPSDYRIDEDILLENGDLVESPPPIPILPVPSPFALREEFERAIVNDLIGPAGGPEEELTESVKSCYLVGMLAPSRVRSLRKKWTGLKWPESSPSGKVLRIPGYRRENHFDHPLLA